MPSLTPHSALAATQSVSFQVSKSVSKLAFPQLSPAEDSYLPFQYTARNVAQRKKNQQSLRSGLHIDNDLPVVGIVAQALSKKDIGMLEQLVEASGSLGMQLVIIADKQSCQVAKKGTIKHMLPTEAHMHLFFGAADILVVPTVVDDAMVAACFRYGLVPVVHNDQSLVRDYDPISEEGNAFTYTEYSVWAIFAALVRALETHRLSYDWQRIERNGMDMT